MKKCLTGAGTEVIFKVLYILFKKAAILDKSYNSYI